MTDIGSFLSAIRRKVTRQLAVSTLFVLSALVLWSVGAQRLAAHEVLPTVADLSVDDAGVLTLDMRINLEAFIAGVDLDAVADTDEDPAASEYDALRALPGAELAARAADVVTGWNAVPLLEAGGPVALEATRITVPDDVDVELPRVSEVTLRATLPAGSETVVVNWPAGAGALVLRQQGVDAPYTGYIDGGQSTPPVSLAGGDAQDGWGAFASYIPVGFDHILPKGLDHILFVLGLFFLSTRLGPLLWQVSAFTLAHTVTLALGALGWVSIPGSIVEPLIAASIVYVAVENLVQRRLTRWRPFVVFGFGLLHGLGFASVLAEFGLPEENFVPALLGFNVGVEIGQLTVIALAALVLLFCVRLAARSDLSAAEAPVASYPVMFRAVSIPGSLLIALVGGWWCIERVFF